MVYYTAWLEFLFISLTFYQQHFHEANLTSNNELSLLFWPGNMLNTKLINSEDVETLTSC
jgi:hypothetical protein